MDSDNAHGSYVYSGHWDFNGASESFRLIGRVIALFSDSSDAPFAIWQQPICHAKLVNALRHLIPNVGVFMSNALGVRPASHTCHLTTGVFLLPRQVVTQIEFLALFVFGTITTTVVTVAPTAAGAHPRNTVATTATTAGAI